MRKIATILACAIFALPAFADVASISTPVSLTPTEIVAEFLKPSTGWDGPDFDCSGSNSLSSGGADTIVFTGCDSGGPSWCTSGACPGETSAVTFKSASPPGASTITLTVTCGSPLALGGQQEQIVINVNGDEQTFTENQTATVGGIDVLVTIDVAGIGRWSDRATLGALALIAAGFGIFLIRRNIG